MSDRVERMIAARDDSLATYIEIKKKYKQDDFSVLVIAEAELDLSFYATRLKDVLPNKYSIIEIPQHGRKNALNAYGEFEKRHWRNFDKERILFFVDKDYPCYSEQRPPASFNVYVTDGYSIENTICRESAFLKMCRQRWSGSNPLTSADIEQIKEYYRSAIHFFETSMLPVVAYQLLWREKGLRPKIKMFSVEAMFIVESTGVRKKEEWPETFSRLCDKCCVPNEDFDISKEELELKEDSINQAGEVVDQVRGKYLDEFHHILLKSLKKLPVKSEGSFNPIGNIKCASDVLLAYASIPESLRIFFQGIVSKLAG